MSQLIRACSRDLHRLDGTAVQRTDIDIEACADRLDLRDLLLVVRHDRGSPAGQNHVRAVIDRHIVRNIVDQRALLPHLIKHLF